MKILPQFDSINLRRAYYLCISLTFKTEKNDKTHCNPRPAL